jgi:archaellum component FlaC
METSLNEIMGKIRDIISDLQSVESRIQSIKDFLDLTENNIEKIKEGTFEGLHHVNNKISEVEKQIKELNSKVDKLLEEKK